MSQDYDKIFKENIEGVVIPLIGKILHIHPAKLTDISNDIQKTIERRADFLKKIISKDNGEEFILQIEFQKDDDPKMAYRMHEYYAILLRKYELPIRQYVFYIDSRKPKMPLFLKTDKLTFEFDLINPKDYDYKIFTESDNPEEIIMGILADFGKDGADKVMDIILSKIKFLPIETISKKKYVVQLEILSKLRNLQKEITEKSKNMALTYDLETDIRFKQGKEIGIEKGIEKGREKEAREIVTRFLKKTNMSIEEIAEISKMPLVKVKELALKIRKK